MNVGAIILAGGKSSRMGQDKGLMLINNKPMISYIIETLKKLTQDITIVSNQKEYHSFGFPIVEDLIKNAGPLAGIYTGLVNAKNTKNIIVSCDVPNISVELLSFLINNSEQSEVVIPENNNKTHQVIGVYDKSCIPFFKQALESNQLKLKDVLKKVKTEVVDANRFNKSEFINVNTPNELNELICK